MAFNESPRAHKIDEVERAKSPDESGAHSKLHEAAGWAPPAPNEQSKNRPIDVELVYGSVQDYQRSEAARQREELHLPANASAADVYKATAEQMVDAFNHAGPKMRGRAMREFGLHESEYNAENLAKVLINRDKRDLRFTGGSLDDLEKAMLARQYEKLKTGDYELSYD